MSVLPRFGRLQIVYGHLDEPETQELKRGVSYLKLRPGKGFPELRKCAL